MLIDALQNLPSYKREPLQARIVMTVIIMSDCIYLWYLVKCARKYKLTKDWRFFFPFIAALFAFANNFNDIVTALLNWTPISWLQTIRLMTFTKVFYSKRTFIIITVINVTLSLGYSICYYLNWGNFTEKVIGVETDRFMFCSPAQKPIEGHDSSFYTTLVMYFDLADSIFSFSVLVYTTYMALDNIKHLKFHHAKIKRMEEEGLIQLIVLTIGKISLYPIMIYLVKKQLTIGDIVWDTLSIIVIICAFRLVNVKYKRINVPDNDDDFI